MRREDDKAPRARPHRRVAPGMLERDLGDGRVEHDLRIPSDVVAKIRPLAAARGMATVELLQSDERAYNALVDYMNAAPPGASRRQRRSAERKLLAAIKATP